MVATMAAASVKGFAFLFLGQLLAAGATSPFPTWKFAYPNYVMPLNEGRPIRIELREKIDKPVDHDCIIIGVIAQESNSSNTATNNKTKGAELGSNFKRLDFWYKGILSKWMEKQDNSTTSAMMQKKERDWEEISKVCRVGLDGSMQVQRLVILRLKGDILADSGKVGRTIGSKVASHMSKSEGEQWALLLPTAEKDEHSPWTTDFVSELTTSLWSSLYKDKRFKSSATEKKLPSHSQQPHHSLDLIWDHPVPSKSSQEGTATGGAFLSKCREAIVRGEMIGSGILLAKDIVNAPHNTLNSLSMAETARRLAAEFPRRISCQVLNTDDCERLNMGAFLGVARGSEVRVSIPSARFRCGDVLKSSSLVCNVVFSDSPSIYSSSVSPAEERQKESVSSAIAKGVF
jgi:leucyl aminopeptidase